MKLFNNDFWIELQKQYCFSKKDFNNRNYYKNCKKNSVCFLLYYSFHLLNKMHSKYQRFENKGNSEN